MDEDMEICEDNLKDLCRDMLYLLKEFKEKGLIKDVEYEKHVYLKQKFLNDIY